MQPSNGTPWRSLDLSMSLNDSDDDDDDDNNKWSKVT